MSDIFDILIEDYTQKEIEEKLDEYVGALTNNSSLYLIRQISFGLDLHEFIKADFYNSDIPFSPGIYATFEHELLNTRFRICICYDRREFIIIHSLVTKLKSIKSCIEHLDQYTIQSTHG